jgi:WXG100 family type VII secretion target
MSTLTVDFAALDELSATIERTIDKTEAVLATLTGNVAHQAELWEGSAAEGFQQTVASWMAGQRDLRRQLEGILDLVVTAHDNHAHAVHTNVATWQV